MDFLVKKAISPSNFSRPPPTIAPLPAPSTPASCPLYPRFRTLYPRFRTLYPRTPRPPCPPPLIYTLCLLGNFSRFLSSADFFKIIFLNLLSGIPLECQTVWIQIRPYVLLGLIWVQTVCKSYQQTTLVD